jgi:hypothetical protein
MLRQILALRNSLAGLRFGLLKEAALREEMILLALSVPVAPMLTRDPWTLVALWGSLLFLLERRVPQHSDRDAGRPGDTRDGSADQDRKGLRLGSGSDGDPARDNGLGRRAVGAAFRVVAINRVSTSTPLERTRRSASACALMRSETGFPRLPSLSRVSRK